MKFICSHCQYSKNIKSSFAGKKVRCPKCKKSTQLADKVADVDSSAADQSIFESDSSVIESLSENDMFPPGERTGAPAATIPVATTADSTPPVRTEPGSNPASSQPASTDGSAAQLQVILDYRVKSGPVGDFTSYGCPYCHQKLTSPLSQAGGIDHCPDCHYQFIVPGEAEFLAAEKIREMQEQERQKRKEERTDATKRGVVNRVAQKQSKQQNVQLDRDPLREWGMYAAFLLLLVGIAAGRYLVSALANDSSYLCFVILGLFVFGLVINFRGIAALRNEYVCAAVCMSNLKKTGGMHEVNQMPTAGILHQHVKDLTQIAKHDTNFTQDSLITLLYSRMMARSRMVDVFSGVLVTLGLIGTIVGLIGMTDGLSTAINSLGDDGQSAELLTGMRSTMAGLGTAFNTTLIGAILGSVVLRILNNVYSSNVDHLVSYVASTSEVTIVPRLKKLAQGGLV